MGWIVTLTHAVEGTVTMSEPEGLSGSIISLTRHPEFKSLVKEFKSAFKSYGSNGSDNGQRDWLKGIERTYGPDAVISILCRYSDDDNFNYTTVFEGEVAIQTFVEALEFDHTLELTPVQKGFWRKFLSRLDTQVNIQSALNLDGEAVTVYTPEVLNLPSQVVRYNGSYEQEDSSFTYNNPSGALQGCQLNFEKKIVDDFSLFDFPRTPFALGTDDENAIGMFEAPWDGSYRIQAKLISAVYDPPTGWTARDTEFKLRIRTVGGTFFVDSPANTTEVVGSESYCITEFDYTINLLRGQQLAIYGINLGSGAGLGNRTIFGTRRLSWKNDVDLLTTITVPLTGEQTIDGVLTSNSDVLVLSQANREQNGIYTTDAGAWTRRADCNTAAELNNAACKVLSGDTGANTFWRQELTVNTIDVDAVSWLQIFSGYIERTVPYTGSDVENYLIITADTTFPRSVNQGFLIHDVAASICDRITDSNKFYSDLIGSQYTQARTYLADGDWWNNANLKGVHLRGYSLTEKLYSTSFKKFWEGLNPMLNLGLGYETVDGVEVIRLEEKAHFFDDSSMSVLFSNVQRIKRRYKTDEYYNSIETGFAKGKVEDISGIDDTQKQTRASIFKNIGMGIKIFTDWIAQSITIEQARRTTRVKSSDYKFDDDTFVIEVTRDGAGEYSPRLNEDFTAVTGLLNEETRYNKHHTPARFFLRWINVFNGCLQNYLGTVYRFTGGEGNYDMTSEMIASSAPDDYSGDVLAENADIPVTTERLYIPIEFEIEHYCTQEEFNTIDSNRNLAVGVSQYETGHQEFFIESLEREIISGQIKMTGYFKDVFEIQNVPQGGQIVQGGRTWDATFDASFGD